MEQCGWRVEGWGEVKNRITVSNARVCQVQLLPSSPVLGCTYISFLNFLYQQSQFKTAITVPQFNPLGCADASL